MAHTSPLSLLYACQLLCYKCKTVLTIPSSDETDTFICTKCHFHDQVSSFPPLPSSPNGGPLPSAHGIDPYKMQVVCVHCMAVLNIPCESLGHCSNNIVCPLCHLHLPSYVFPVDSSSLTSQSAEQPQKVMIEIADESDVKDVESSKTIVEEEPVRSIFLLKDRKRIREFEKVDDCFILDFVPDGFSSCSKLTNGHDAVLLPKQEQVLCRDYPHQRNFCSKHPFNETAHDVHCEVCYCHVCDMTAPCKKWTKGDTFRHCDANADISTCEHFRNQRRNRIYPF